MDTTKLDSTVKTMQINTLLNKFKKQEFEVLGVKVISDGMVEGTVSDSYLYDISTESNVEFTSILKIHGSDIEKLKTFAYVSEQTGYVEINMDELYGQLKMGQGFLTATILKDMATSDNFRVSMRHQFVNPTIEYQDFKVGTENNYRLYRVQETGTVDNLEEEEIEYTHGIEFLTVKKRYDGETLLGKLSKSGELTKAHAKNLLALLEGNTLLNKEIGGAYYTDGDLRVNLFNLNFKGMEVIVNKEEQRLSVLSSNSFINFDLAKLKGANIISKADNTRFEINFIFGKEKELTIYI